MKLKTTLEQWLTLQAIDEAGSIQAAASRVHKSHTTLLYSVRKLEDQLGVALVTVKGRRAVLTEQGHTLLRRASPMLEQAQSLESIAEQLVQGMESEIRITMDHLCNREWLYQPLAEFMAHNSATSVHIRETSLSATQQAVTEQQTEIAIVTLPITNYHAEAFGQVLMRPAVAPHHELAQRGAIHMDDLLTATQIVIRDLLPDEGELSSEDKQNVGWLRSQRRITVDNFDHALSAVRAGVGFCRLPDHVLAKVENADLVRLNLQGGQQYQVPLHLVLPCQACTGPAAQALYDCLLAHARTRLQL